VRELAEKVRERILTSTGPRRIQQMTHKPGDARIGDSVPASVGHRGHEVAKLLFPILVIIGIAVGLFLLIRRRHVPLVHGRNRLMAVILTAAASVAGIQCAGSSGTKSADEVRSPATKMGMVKGPMQHIQKRIEMLEQLHAQGKLTDAVYQETLVLLEEDLSIMEISKLHAVPMSEAEKTFVDMRRKMDEALLIKLGEEESWKALREQVTKLSVLLGGGKREFDGEKVQQAINELHIQGLLDQKTAIALNASLTEVHDHYVRVHPVDIVASCYEMTLLGTEMRHRRTELTEMMAAVELGAPTEADFINHLGVLARSVGCFSTEDVEVCQSDPGVHDRLLMVTALDLLIALLH
jgi:hypothetical protein